VKPGAPGLLPAERDWWLLPTGRTVSIRKIEGRGRSTECVVRYVDEHGGMSQGDFSLSLAYVSRGRKVGRDAA
jgi:hypothetical protein